MLQDILPKKLINHYDTSAKISEDDIVISFVNDDVLVSIDEGISFPFVSELIDRPNDEEFIYLFSIDEQRYFLMMEQTLKIDKDASSANYSYVNFSTLRGVKIGPKYQLYALYTARHLRDWYRDNMFCGKCGKPMHKSTEERCMVCDCGYHSYPRIMPAVIVGVIHKDRLLITRYRNGYAHNALVAGFVEIGETVEETVAREVMEEAGLAVKNIRYYKSQPWGVANDILLGYYCEVDGDATVKMDDNELKYAQFLLPDEIELQPDDISLTNEMMRMFKEGKVKAV